MHSFKKLLSKLVPASVLDRMIRSRVSLSEVAFDKDFSVEIAKSKEDLESAYSLLHECYVSAKLMKSHSSGLRCNWYSVLPQTTTIVVKYKGVVAGTVSLIVDSSSGLPSDSEYLLENNELRRSLGRLVEVSALAVSRKFRHNGHIVSLLLMKYLFNYATKFLQAKSLVCTIHDRAEAFYRALWHFRRNGKLVKYPYVEGARAIHMSLEISPVKSEQIINSYETEDIRKNLALFVLSEDSRFQYPNRIMGQVLDPVMTPELLNYFFVERTSLCDEISHEKKNFLFDMYKAVFGRETVEEIFGKVVNVEFKRSYRVPTDISVLVSIGDQTTFGRIINLNSDGCFITLSETISEFNGEIRMSFKLGDKLISAKGVSTWKNNGVCLHQNNGFGVKFLAQLSGVDTYLQKLMQVNETALNKEPASA